MPQGAESPPTRQLPTSAMRDEANELKTPQYLLN
jgi:hypothetical protein